MSQQTYTDPASGRAYTIDPATGQARWVDTPPPPAGPGHGYYPTPAPAVTIHQTVTTGREGPRHGLHLLGTVLTCGAWAPVWLGITVVHATAREVTVTGPDGRPTVRRKARPEVVVGLVVGFLVLAGIGAVVGPPKSTAPATVPAPAPLAAGSTPAPSAAKAAVKSWTDGTYAVGTEIKPGRYRVVPDDGSSCYVARLKDTDGSFDSILSNDNIEGNGYWTVKRTDKFVEIKGCTLTRA